MLRLPETFLKYFDANLINSENPGLYQLQLNLRQYYERLRSLYYLPTFERKPVVVLWDSFHSHLSSLLNTKYFNWQELDMSLLVATSDLKRTCIHIVVNCSWDLGQWPTRSRFHFGSSQVQSIGLNLFDRFQQARVFSLQNLLVLGCSAEKRVV